MFVVVSPGGSVLIWTFTHESGDPETLDLDASGGSELAGGGLAVYTPLMVVNFAPCGGGIAGLPRLDIGRGQPQGRLRTKY